MAHPISPHHRTAVAWSDSVRGDSAVVFSRITQLGLLRVLTTAAAMGRDVITQSQAWRILDVFFENPNVILANEPPDMDRLFRRYTDRNEASPKQWADGYIAAFVEGHGFKLVTFDRALAERVNGSLLLKSPGL